MQDNYKDISSAPKDGTLLKLKECGNLGRFVAYYYGLYKDNKWIDYHFKNQVVPTHWKHCDE